MESATPLTANRDGFSLNASVACRPEERKRLERLCRYAARPPLALERLGCDGDGLVVHRLKRPFRDGTTEFLFEPLDFLAWLAALVPRPRSHLLRYHGVLAPNARHRRLEYTLSVFEDEITTHPRVLTIALHPHLIGVPHGFYWFRRMIDDLLARDDTIFVTGSQIADWFIEADGTGGADVA